MALNKAVGEMDLTDLYRAFQPQEAKYTFFSNTHATFSKIEHMVGHKKASTSSRKLKSYQAFSLTTRY